jgi:hypothetical protein
MNELIKERKGVLSYMQCGWQRSHLFFHHPPWLQGFPLCGSNRPHEPLRGRCEPLELGCGKLRMVIIISSANEPHHSSHERLGNFSWEALG